MTAFSNPFRPTAFSQGAHLFKAGANAFGGDPANRRTHHKFRALVESGPEAVEEELRSFLEKQPTEAIADNPRASWQTALEVLDLPGNAFRNAIYRPLGVKPSSHESFAGLPKIYGADALRAAGWEPDSVVGKAGQFIAGLGLDFITDPLTWLAGAGGAALGTVVAGAPGAAGGWLAGTSAVKWFQGVAQGAQKLGKGVSVLKTAELAEDAVKGVARAASRVHIKPEGLSKFEELIQGFEKAGHRDPITAAAEAFQTAHGDLTYNSRLGFGFGTSAARNLPFGHLIVGPPLIGSKAVGTAVELTGQVIGKAGPLGKIIGKPIELAARVAQVPLDLLGAASDVVGTPLKYLPQVDKFIEVGQIPGVGKGVKWLSETLAASDSAVALGGSLKNVGRAIKESAAKAGIGPKTPLAALILNKIGNARAGIRQDTAPGGIIHETQRILTEASGATQIPERELNALSTIALEGTGEIAKALAGGDPEATVARVFDRIRVATTAALGDTASVDTVLKSTDEIMATISKETGVDYIPKRVKADRKIQTAEELERRAGTDESRPTWFVKSQRVVEAKVPARIAPAELRSLLKKSGVKDDELRWTGLDELTAGNKSVTREKILATIAEHDLGVQEVVKGGPDDSVRPAEYGRYTQPGGSNYRELLLTLPVRSESAAPMAFKGPHFEEPNVVAHVRMTNRRDGLGRKVLFLEEVQSDWHEAGRRKGYDKATGGVDPAPFAKSWPDLALKRMMRWAAAEGYDRLAWTTGRQQNELYSLEKHVESLGISRLPVSENEPQRYELTARKVGGGFVNGVGAGVDMQHLTSDELAEVVGKEMATRLIKKIPPFPEHRRSPYAEISGADLKIGGSGMRGFYDRMLPRIANKIAKRWGGRVRSAVMPNMSERKWATYDGLIPPPQLEASDPKKSWSEWLQKNKKGAVEEGSLLDRNFHKVMNIATQRYVSRGEQYTWEDAFIKVMDEEGSKRLYRVLGGNSGFQSSLTKVHAVEITDQMRESVLAGQPLFMPRRPRKPRKSRGTGLEHKRHGLGAARKVLVDLHDGEMSDLVNTNIGEGVSFEEGIVGQGGAGYGEGELPAGFTFANKDQYEELAWRFTPDQLKRLKHAGMMSINPAPGKADYEDFIGNLSEATGDGETARDMVAMSMIEHLGFSADEKATRVIEFLKSNRDYFKDPQLDYDVRVYERIRDGDLALAKSPRKGKPPIESERLGIADLQEGEWVTIAGEEFQVAEVGSTEFMGQTVPHAKLINGTDESGFGASDIHLGADEPDEIVIDKGSRRPAAEHEILVMARKAAEETAARYRSPIHQTVGMTAREAGLPHEQAELFDAALSDIAPERLKGLDVKVMQGDFAGMYQAAQRAVTFGRGNLTEATEALHEIGHFAYDWIFTKADQDVFRKWWQIKPVEERIGIFRRGEGRDDLRNRYLAGDSSLTRADLKQLDMTPEQYGKVLKDPSREGFAQQFAYYALTRRAGRTRGEFGTLFEKALDLVRRMWRRMKGNADGDRAIADLFESIFDTEQRMLGKDLPQQAIHLKMAGMKYGDLSMDFKAGKNGKPEAAARYAKKAVTAEHAGRLVAQLGLADPNRLILVPVPSATGQNHIPEAMSRRLASLTGGKVRKLLESNIVQERPGKGVLRRLANPRQFVSAEFPGDLPSGSVVVLVDDSMHAGSTLRDAGRQLTRTGVDVQGMAVGAITGSRNRTEIQPSQYFINNIRSKVGEDGVAELERVIGRKIDRGHLTYAEAEELSQRFEGGWTTEDIAGLMTEARKTPGLPDEALDPSVINKVTLTELDDLPGPEDRMLERIRDQIEAGVMRPTWSGVKEYAKTLNKTEKMAMFGVTRVTDANKRLRHEVELGLLRLGHGVRSMGWEGVLEALENVAAGRRGRVAASLEKPGGLIKRTTVDGRDTLSLTYDGELALKAIRESIQHGGDPGHVERLTIELQQLEARRMQILRAGRPVTPNIWHRIKLKRRVLKNMGKTVLDDPAYRDWVAARDAEKAARGVSSPSSPGGTGTPPPPATPGGPAAAPAGSEGPRIRMPTPEEMYTEPVAKLVRQLQLVRSDTEALERAGGVVTSELDTHRGLGYFPHYLGSAKSVVGKAIRASGMAWETEIRRMQKLPGEMRQLKKGPRTAKQMLDAVIHQENRLRKSRGETLIEAPAADTPIGQAIAEVLAEHPELRPFHASQLRRTFLHELTVQEINSLAEFTGVAFQTNPVEVFKARRVMAHLAVAGVDFLKSAIQLGVEDGWVVEVKAKGQVPDGFERITDRRFGNIAKGYAFSKEVAREFRKFQGFSDKPHAVLKALDWVTDQWRTSVLGVTPYTMTNLLGGVFQSNIFNAFRYKTWSGVRSMMIDIHNGVPGKVLGDYVKGLPKEFAGQDIQDFYNLLSVTHGELGKGQYGVEMERAVKDGIRTEWGVLAEFMRGTRGKTTGERIARGVAGAYRDESGRHLRLGESAYFRAFRSFNVAIEDWMSMGFITERLRQGDDLAMAISKKRLALNQSADLTDFEKNVFRRMIPFWGWMKGNAVLQFTAALARPQLAGAVPKIRGNIESAMVGDENLAPSLRPRHVSEELGVQLTGGQKPEFVNATRLFPVREIGLTPLSGHRLPDEIAGEVIQRINPVVKVPTENIINRDLYWDRPIQEYEGQRRRFLGFNLPPKAKRVARLVRQLNVAEQVSWRGVPSSAKEAGFSGAQSVGLRVFPVDVARQVNSQQRALNDQGGAVMRDMHRARLRAERSGRPWQSDPEVQRLASIYADLMEKRDALPFKALRESSAAYLKERRGQRKELREFARN